MSKKKQMNTTHFDNKILNLNLKEAMKSYYMDYAMSIIVSRALPDVRDGLKPVHRRILYSMADLKLFFDGKYKKSARTVGEVLGKYHPHGDSSVYDALVRMAQYFSLRYPLVDGHGNFGSIDGDSPAAMRYTESKLAEITNEMLRDIKMNTVDMIPNFDGEELEPSLLPCRFPNLLVNGSSGIAVGFATNMPPHNLKDAIEQVIYQIDNPNCSIKELVDILKAPDFPLGGIIVNPQDMLSVYSKGSGAITVRSKYHIEDETSIVFTEIPYGINKLALLDKLVMLKDGYMKKVGKGKKAKDEFVPPLIPQINKIEDLSDEIDGIQIIIDVDNKDNIDTVLKLLFENSQLQDNFNANFTGVMGNTLYEKMSLKEINRHYIMYQKQVIERRTSFQLDKAEKELNRLEGIIKILGDIDKTIEIIKTAKNNEIAKIGLINHFGINEKQAEIILEMKLKRLTCLEVETMKERYENICAFIEKLKKILSSEEEILNVIKSELTDIMNKYSDGRKTELLYEDNLAHIDTKSVEVQDYNCRILLTNSFIKKHMKYSPNHKLKDGDSILCDITTTNRSTLLAFSNKGNRYKLDCSSLTEKKPSEYGDSINRIFKDMDKDEKIIKVVSIEDSVGYMVFTFKNGKVAKVNIDKYLSAYKVVKNCYSLDSELVDMAYIKEDVDILSINEEGRGLIYNTSVFDAKNTKNTVGSVAMKSKVDIIATIIDVKPNSSIELTTMKNKVKVFPLDETIKATDERTWFNYVCGKKGNSGNFLINTRPADDKIISTKLIK